MNRFFGILLCLLAVVPFVTAQKRAAKKTITKQVKYPYQNPQLPVNQRVEDLLGRMTLDEKVGEMTQLCASSITLNGTKELDLNVDKIRDYIKNQHVGSFLSGTGNAKRWADFIGAIQKVAVEETRLGIPIIFGMDNVHGSNYVDEGTMLPHNLNMGCTFNPALMVDAAKITAVESADLGHHWNFAPVLDVGRYVYWPRLYETFGEDPYLCGLMGSTFIKAFEDCQEVAPYKQAACAKHFIGYSQPLSGWDRTPSEIPDQVIQEFFVPSFKAAFDAGVKTLMVNSGELNGEPVHGSKKWLTNVLREQLQFDGVILTDIKDIMKMVEMHKAFPNEKAATLAAINAGVDMSMACSDVNFIKIVKDLVEEGALTEERINESVRRILKLKFELALFEHPYPRYDRINLIGSKAHYERALQAAKESIVLLKNEKNTLPLANGKKVLLAGFAANNKRNLNGAWTLEWLGAPESRQPKGMKTLYQAMQEQFGVANVVLADSNAETPGHAAVADFKNKAKGVDAIVLTLGEQPYSEFKGNLSDLSLTANHSHLLKEALATGKPVIVVFIGGRPRVFTEEDKQCAAVLFAGHPGVAAGPAIAEILAGKYNPSGRLAFSWPSHVGHTVPYNHKPSERSTALYPFGHGLSYSKVSYSKPTITDSTINPLAKKLTVASVTIKNEGKMAVHEPVLWYVNQEYGTGLTRPVKALKHIEKVMLQPGESKTVSFSINPMAHFAYPDEHGKSQLDAGNYKILVGDQTLKTKVLER